MKLNDELIFVAEIGMNHNGNKGLFFELIKKASEAGADIAKFQLGWRSNPGEINDLSDEDVSQIYKCCDYFKIEPMFSILNLKSLELLDKYHVEKYKIASRTLIDDISLEKK